jgi:hypothetical protein
MAPEQAAGDNEAVDERSVVYGLAGILAFLLADCEVPRPLAAICTKTRQNDAESRHGSAAEMAADVRRFLNGEPLTAYRENPLEIAMRWTARHQTLVFADPGLSGHARADDLFCRPLKDFEATVNNRI